MVAPRTLTSESLHIREVWADNLDEEMAIIRDIVDEFPYLAMDTEFPGVVRCVAGRRLSSALSNSAIMTRGRRLNRNGCRSLLWRLRISMP